MQAGGLPGMYAAVHECRWAHMSLLPATMEDAYCKLEGSHPSQRCCQT